MIDGDDVEDDRNDDVSHGRNSDPKESIGDALSENLREKFEIFSYRNAANILKSSFPAQYTDLVAALTQFEITTTQIRTPGGSKSDIAKYMDTLLDPSWKETRISADLHVKLLPPKGPEVYQSYVREGYLDGHRIDFLKGRVAFDFEWNSKDQTYDRDLYAFSAFYEAGAIDVGVILTRGTSLNNNFFRSLGNALNKEGNETKEPVHKKFGASTTWMGKLLYRLDAGRNGGCPVLAIGITPRCVIDC